MALFKMSKFVLFIILMIATMGSLISKEPIGNYLAIAWLPLIGSILAAAVYKYKCDKFIIKRSDKIKIGIYFVLELLLVLVTFVLLLLELFSL